MGLQVGSYERLLAVYFHVLRFCKNFFSEFEKLFESTKDDSQIRTGLCACFSWIVMDAGLGDCISFVYGSGEDFGIYQCAGAADCDVVEDSAFEQLEGAVNVSQVHVKYPADKFSPGPGIEFSDKAFLPIEAIAGDYIVLSGHGQKGGHLVDVKLSIAVGIKDKFLSSGTEA